MKQLKSSHVDLQSTTNVQAANGSSTSTTSTPTNVTVQVKGSGVQQLPDQEQLNLTINNATNLAEILQGNKVYVKNSQGHWYVMDKNALQNMAGNPFSNFSLDPNSLLGVLSHIKLADGGTQSLNGASVRHITATLDKTALQELLTNNPQLKSTFGQQNVNEVISNAKSFLSTVDVWIDNSNFYIRRSELKVNLDANTGSLGPGVPSDIKTALDTLVNLSQFNVPITITPPTNATPTNNPAAVLG